MTTPPKHGPTDADRAHTDAERRHDDAERSHVDKFEQRAEGMLHPSPCPALETFQATFGIYRNIIAAGVLLLVGVLTGMNAVVWSQIRTQLEDQTEVKVDMASVKTRMDERFGAFAATQDLIVANQDRILQGQAALLAAAKLPPAH
jgi:hypothetical protein